MKPIDAPANAALRSAAWRRPPAVSPMLREARRAVDAAMSRDRGRLQGLWSRWRDRPDDPRAQAAFEQALANSIAIRQARAARLPAAPTMPVNGVRKSWETSLRSALRSR